MRIIVILILSILIRVNHAQVINPKIWYIGYQSPAKRDTNTLDNQPYLLGHGANVIDFRKNPVEIKRNGYTLGLVACNAQIFDKNDSLILYSNGSKIFNGKHRLIEGGDSLSYGKDWSTSPFAGSYYGQFHISAIPNPMLIIPDVKNVNLYYVISVYVTKDSLPHYKLVYSLVDMSLNSGNGKVILKESIIKYGNFAAAIAACKHGNGKDWWVMAREHGRKNFTILKLDSSGIKVHSESQISGWDLSTGPYGRNATNKFSSDGSMFASFTINGTEIFDFNRCDATLSNRREIVIPMNDTFDSAGVGCFSPDNKLLYTGNGKYYYQVELKNLKIRKIATYDNFQDTPTGQTGGIPTNFGSLQPAYDGRIYMTTTETTRYLHTIENPNDTGILCNFKQHSIKLLTFNSGLPHYPNYELGAVADKCGESGIADNEIEKIEVYPNPASDYIDISSSTVIQSRYISGLFRNLSITVTNLLGQQTSLPVEVSSRGYRIDTRALSEEIYMLQIRDIYDNLIKTERIVIQRDQ
jgi:hypothetical protein